jgi:Protein of unknown function (DUF2934)
MNEATAARTAHKPKTSKQPPTHEPSIQQIRQRAYEIYLSRREGSGDELQDWLQAERELRSKQS